ncbi:MAG: CPBP family intramembrane metalloprotease [Candidatus Krumholzibacteria bacterium]|nr:CPBP family intramembrane metalloprotease [Candidatus Krumholzibacteria bacterium]
MEETTPRNTPPDVFTAVNNYFLLFFCASCVLSSMYIQQLFALLEHYRVGIGVSSLLGIIIPVYLLTRRFPAGIRGQLRIARPRWPRLLLVIAATAGVVVLVDQIYVITQHFSPVPDDYAEAIRELKPEGPLQFLVILIGLCMLVPLAEEVVFRGLIQQIFQRNLGALLAVALSGAVFGAVHLNAHLLISITVFGWYLGWVYYATGNLTYTMVSHALFNLTALVQLTWSNDMVEGGLPIYLQDTRIVVGALVIFVFLLFKMKEGGPETEPPYTQPVN